MYERPCIYVKVKGGSTFTFMQDLPYIAFFLIYACTHVKILRDSGNRP